MAAAAAISNPADDRLGALDALRGVAVLWMTAYHFAFDLDHYGYIQQDFHHSPLWTVQRTCILGLFLFCAGFGQALATAAGQRWPRFWRRWARIAAAAVLVSLASWFMFPRSWIYFGVLHGMAVMLLVARLTASWGRWLWPAGLAAIALGLLAPRVHAALGPLPLLDQPLLNWLGLISRKPVTEDYVPLLPWLGVVWWGVAAGQQARARGWTVRGRRLPAPPALAWLGRWSLSWYLLHQPLLIGLLLAFGALR
jgi:uncharacterized membrane protein